MILIQEVYDNLENLILEGKTTSEIKNYLIDIRYMMFEKQELQDIPIIQWEIDVLSFNISNNKLSGSFFGTDENGLYTEYPRIANFTSEFFDYIKKRLEASKSPFLRAIYSHLLWLSPAKNIMFAKNAIDSYLELVPIVENYDELYPEKYFGLQISHIFSNLFPLSSSVDYKIDEVKSEIKRVVKTFSTTSTAQFAISLDLSEIMLQNKKIFHNKDFVGIARALEKIARQKLPDNKDQAITLFEKIIRIKKRQKVQYLTYQKQIANLWYLKAKEEGLENVVRCKFLEISILLYKELKDHKKVHLLEKEFNKLKKEIRLFTFSEEIDFSEHSKALQKLAVEIVSGSTEDIINTLMYSDLLYPKYSHLELQYEKDKGKYFYKELFSNSVLDSNGNTVQHFEDEKEKKKFEILQFFGKLLQFQTIPLLHFIFLESIQKRKLTAKSILEYLYKNSWFGTELKISTNGQRERPYNWLSLIAPALNEFFINLRYYLTSPEVIPNYILCIDSLSTKIEGIVRDICEFQGITTFEFKVDGKGRSISMQKDIHKLLNEEGIVNLISEDDLLFLKYVLVEKIGLNLRHQVAHSLMTFDEYHIKQMYLLIVCVLKFGKYDFVGKIKS